jgi:sodium/pantothenate symporter
MVNLAIVVFVVYLLIILAVSYYTANHMQNVDVEDYQGEFFVGGRNLGVLVTAILVAAGAVSTGTFIGGPGLTWVFGPAITFTVFAQTAVTLYLLGIYGKKVGIISRRIDASSLLDIFKVRYSNYRPFVLLAVLSILIFLEAYLSAEFVGGARVIEAMTGLPYLVSLFAFGGIIILYTTFGGLRGAGVVGVLQGIFMTVGTLALVVGSVTSVENIFQTVEAINPQLMRPPGNGMSWFFYVSLFITFSFAWLGLPHAIQGTLGYDSTKTLRQAAALGVVMVFLWSLATVVIAGSAGKALNPQNIPPDMNLPLLTLETLPDILAGVVLAGVVGAAQTTIAAMSIVVSSSIVVNIYDEYVHPDASPQRRKTVTRVVTALVGVVGLLLAVREPHLLEIIVIFAIGGLASTLAFPLLLGMYWPRANRYGAFVGGFGGLVSYIVLKQWGPAPINSTPILISLVVSLVLMVVVSLRTEKPPREVISIYFGKDEIQKSK